MAPPRLWTFIVTLASLNLAAFAAPSPSSLNSSLTLLYQNDLDWTTATEHFGSILVDPRSYEAAVSSCASLSETLLAVEGKHFSADMKLLLSFLAFDGRFSDNQEYWISSQLQGPCLTITKGAIIQTSSCQRTLPAFCSQSAPARAASTQASDQISNWQVTVTADDLTVTGYRDQLSFRFLGIPYADMPQRFAYPKLYSGIQKNLNATSYGSQCLQGGIGSEDCLFLNIYTPYLPQKSSISNLKPVMVHIHGGGFTTGTGNDPTFDGGNAASRSDVVIVNINYRLSTLGFLALSDGLTKGNFGIADMTVALDWVQKYVSAFGGDPSKVTILGQSAGAAATRALLASPKAIGKFAAAIPMSNLAGRTYATSYSLYSSIATEVAQKANRIIALTGCNETTAAATLDCLRSIDPRMLLALPTTSNSIVVDGTYVTSKQLPVDGSSPTAHVPVLMGFMRDDGAAFVGYPPNDNLTQAISGLSLGSPTSNEIIGSGLFPEPPGQNLTLNVFNVTARLSTDYGFRCLDQAAAISAVKHDVFPKVWFYQFDRAYQLDFYNPNAPVCNPPIDAAHPDGDPSKEYFKCHAGDLYYVWGSLGQFSLPYRDTNDLIFSQFALDTWTSFARTHDPNPSVDFLMARGYDNTLNKVKKSTVWQPLSKQGGNMLRLLDIDAISVPFSEETQCGLLNLPSTYYG